MMNLGEILDQRYKSDTLMALGKELLKMPTSLTRKQQRIDYFAQHLLDPVELRKLWDKLDDLAQKAVVAAYHNSGVFNKAAFYAHYGAFPERPPSKHNFFYIKGGILFDLFVFDDHIPIDMMPVLAKFIPPPDIFKLATDVAAPDIFESKRLFWTNDGKPAYEAVPIAIISAETERTGWADLLSYLRLLEQGALKTTAAGGLNARSVQKVFAALVEEEFLPQAEKMAYKDTIRIFGLATFVAQADFGRRSRITQKGRAFLNSRDPELLLEGFEAWSEDGTFDELTRNQALSGLKSRKTHLTKPFERRSRIIEALSWCPTDVWINIDDFYRAALVWEFDFEVENITDSSNLGFGSSKPSNYYSAWYSADDYWRATKGLLINTIIWEYLGSLGAVDIAYVHPKDAQFRLSDDYSTDAISYTRYDGLQAFRINPLGAFLLGQAREYLPTQLNDQALFVISAEKQLTLTHPANLTPDLRMLLNQLTDAESDTVYRLSAKKLLDAVSAGYGFEVILEFLTDYHTGPLPTEITQWLSQLKANQKVFKVGPKAVFINVATSAQMDIITNDSVLSKLSTPLTSKRVVVTQANLTRFRNRLKELEYLMLG